ncbi:MAG: hypothetical protein ACRC8G_08915 [Plesiomonas shigelloides]
MKLRWKLDDKETGLRGVCAGPRGSKYHDGNDYYASVSCMRNGKWVWSAQANNALGIEWRNSAAEGIYFDSAADAKCEAKKHIDAAIARLEKSCQKP